MVLLAISFVAGVLTVLAPCVLPLLPVIVGGSLAGGSRRRAYIICISLGISIIAFTLLLKATTVLLGIPQWVWQWISGGILLLFGFTMVFPRLWDSLPFVASLNRGSNALLAFGYQKDSPLGDALMGAALGPVFASCSPTYFVILATVLPASFLMGVLDLLAYALGLSGFLLIVALLGQKLVDRLNITVEPGGWFRRSVGALFILVGILVATGTMTRIEIWLLDKGLFDITGIEQSLLGVPEKMDTPQETAEMLSAEAKALMYRNAPELVSPDGYLNTDEKPITIGEFKGKNVVLVVFWTYTCINCQREIPYLKEWYDTYADQGLEIIGIHTPEFSFEKAKSNVEDAVRRFGISYPVVQDNEYQTWRAFGNQFWPRRYLVDLDGFIVYDHVGEGDYEGTEAAIQRALRERAQRLGVSVQTPHHTGSKDATAVDFRGIGSPEIYFGSDRNENLGNGKVGVQGPQELELPARYVPNTLYVGGMWNFRPEYAENSAVPAHIRFLYSAKHVYFVASSETGVKIAVTRDGGKPLGTERGADLNEQGEALIRGERLYELVNGNDYTAHLLEVKVEGKGLKVYTFTFG